MHFFVLLFIAIVSIYFYLINNVDKNALLNLFFGSLFSFLLIGSVFLINKIPAENFLAQYIFYPFSLGEQRIDKLNIDFNNLVGQFKFIYFMLIPLVVSTFFLGRVKEKNLMDKALELSQSIKSNKTISFRVLAQIASAVPKRVKFSSIDYNGSDLIVIEGTAFSDQDILKLISNLNNKKLISQASLASMTLPNDQQSSQTMKGFKIACILESV